MENQSPADRHQARMNLIRNCGDQELIDAVRTGNVSINEAVARINAKLDGSLDRNAALRAEPAATDGQTDLSNEMRRWAGATEGYACDLIRKGADEIERYYGGMLNWKATAEKRDAEAAGQPGSAGSGNTCTNCPNPGCTGCYDPADVAALLSVAPAAPIDRDTDAAIFPPLPNHVYRHTVIGDLFDRMAMHQYALRYADNIAVAPLAVPVQAEQSAPLVFDDYPNFNSVAMGCGLENRGITDRYGAMRYGWDEAMERVGERIDGFVSDLAAPAAPLPLPVGPSEPHSQNLALVIARLEQIVATEGEFSDNLVDLAKDALPCARALAADPVAPPASPSERQPINTTIHDFTELVICELLTGPKNSAIRSDFRNLAKQYVAPPVAPSEVQAIKFLREIDAMDSADRIGDTCQGEGTTSHEFNELSCRIGKFLAAIPGSAPTDAEPSSNPTKESK